MANFYTAFDSTGLIVSTFELEVGATPATGDYPSTGGYVSGSYDPELWYIADPAGTKTPTLRPTLSVEAFYTIEGNNVDAVSVSVPSGTLITDLETNATQTAAGADTFEFKSNGRTGHWFVQIDPPFPYAPSIVEVYAYADDN